MKIVKPYAKIVGSTIDSLRLIEEASRISHRSEDMQTEDSWRRFIKAVVIDHGDWSVVEHATVIVEMYVDRGITHELVRHRLFSYTQESTRFVNYEKKMPPSFIYPKVGVECDFCLAEDEPQMTSIPWDVNPWVHGTHQICHYDQSWLTSIQTSEDQYVSLLKAGWRPQEARSVFPNALASKIWMTGNLRNWRHFFLMRTTKEAHPQMRQVTIPLLVEFKKRFPILFDDIAPESRQADNISKGR
jgi:thymidylate synthase (FAD)